MLRRFDLMYSTEFDKWIMKENLPKGQQEEELKNWVLEIKKDNLIVVGLSKANKTKDRIQFYPLKEGSLFLYNSTYNWYSYFREKEIQEVFDTHNIIKCINIWKQTVLVHCTFINGISINPVTKILGYQPIKIYKNENDQKHDNTGTLENIHILYLLNEGDKGLIVQKGKHSDSNIVYIDDNISLCDLDWYLSTCETISDFPKYVEDITATIDLRQECQGEEL